MKKIPFHHIVILVLSLSAVSCDFFGGGKSSQLNLKEVESIEQLQDTVKKLLDTQDALYAGLAKKIDTMAVALNVALKTTDSNFKTLEKQVAALREPTKIWNYVTLGCVVVILVLIAVIVVIYTHLNRLRRDLHISVRENIIPFMKNTNVRLEKIEQSLSNKSYSKNASSDSSEISSLKRRIKDLEDRLQQGPMETYSIGPKDRAASSFTSTRIGYANINSKQYFLDVFDTKQEASVYEIHFKSDTEGIFDIISLDKIKSRNNWQDVIDAHGDCLMPEANRYEREDYGICKKVDDSTWEVTKKLKIKLHR